MAFRCCLLASAQAKTFHYDRRTPRMPTPMFIPSYFCALSKGTSCTQFLVFSLDLGTANMKTAAVIPTRFVCQLCQLSKRVATTRALSTFAQPARKYALGRAVACIEPINKRQRRTYATASITKIPAQNKRRKEPAKSPATPSTSNIEENLKWITDTSRDIISSETVPDELDVLEILSRSQEVSNILMFGTLEQPQVEAPFDEGEASSETGPTSSLLELEDENDGTVYGGKASSSNDLPVATRQRAVNIISSTIYDLLNDRKVFITPDALNVYTRIQLLLGRPQYLPQIFDLYATKPVPKLGSSPITYSKPWKSHPRNAVDLELSGAALDAAIANKDLPLALAIIDTTVATPSFRFAKVLRKAALPFAAFAALPFVAYTGADWLAHYQNTMDEEYARMIVLMASTAYIGTVSIIGFVALTTYNDQMERVSWQPGYRLRDRWLHEEERLYFDRVAMAWGFKEKWRRGEEQGEEWEALREFLGMRMMVLDKSSLMEGME